MDHASKMSLVFNSSILLQVNLDEASNATRVVTTSSSGFLGKVVQHVTPIPPDEGGELFDRGVADRSASPAFENLYVCF